MSLFYSGNFPVSIARGNQEYSSNDFIISLGGDLATLVLSSAEKYYLRRAQGRSVSRTSPRDKWGPLSFCSVLDRRKL